MNGRLNRNRDREEPYSKGIRIEGLKVVTFVVLETTQESDQS
jgi:hypothetical protein